MKSENSQGIDAVVVSCIDYRFIELVLNFLREKEIKSFDLISVTGATRQRNVVKKQLFASFTLHHPKQVILVQHEDDGAYGGSVRFKNQEEEFAAYKEDLRRMGGWIKRRVSKSIAVNKYIIRSSGEVINL